MMPRLPHPRRLVQEHFLTGILTVIPILVIFWLAGLVIAKLWDLRSLLPDAILPEHLFQSETLAAFLNFVLVIVVTCVLIFAISFVGWISKKVLGKKLLQFFSEIIQYVPVLRSIYAALDQLLRTFASQQGGKQFHQVVYVEFPKEDSWTLAFVTGPVISPSFPHENFINVFVPATPNPTAGFFFMVSEKKVIQTDFSVEEAFRIIISLGISQPEPKKPVAK